MANASYWSQPGATARYAAALADAKDLVDRGVLVAERVGWRMRYAGLDCGTVSANGARVGLLAAALVYAERAADDYGWSGLPVPGPLLAMWRGLTAALFAEQCAEPAEAGGR